MQDHLKEIHSKWDAIEDDIWAKIIVMERNRRVAKAYIRSPTITIGGGYEGFDGKRIGLQGFGNPLRDQDTKRILRKINEQVREGAVQVLHDQKWFIYNSLIQ